jgi:predicted RNase H-like HicB family nuclease
LGLKLKDVVIETMKEKDGSFAVSCSALGVYSVGRTLEEAKTNFEEALILHLSVTFVADG